MNIVEFAIARIMEMTADLQTPGPEKMKTLLDEVGQGDAPEGLEDIAKDALGKLIPWLVQHIFEGLSKDRAALKEEMDPRGTPLSQNFTWAEARRSGLAAARSIPNKPGLTEAVEIKAQATEQLQKIRNKAGVTRISSWYRSPDVQLAVYEDQLAAKKGKAKADLKKKVLKSQHIKGQAADIIVPGMSRNDLVALIHAMDNRGEIAVDQCIVYDWGSKAKQKIVHISHRSKGGNRSAYLRSEKPGSYKKY